MAELRCWLVGVVVSFIHDHRSSIIDPFAVRSFVPSFVPSFQSTFVRSFQSSVVRSFQSSFVPKFVCSNVRSFQRSFVPKFVRSKVRSFQSSFVPKFVRSKVRSCVPKFVRSFVTSSVASFVCRCVRRCAAAPLRRCAVNLRASFRLLCCCGVTTFCLQCCDNVRRRVVAWWGVTWRVTSLESQVAPVEKSMAAAHSRQKDNCTTVDSARGWEKVPD